MRGLGGVRCEPNPASWLRHAHWVMGFFLLPVTCCLLPGCLVPGGEPLELN